MASVDLKKNVRGEMRENGSTYEAFFDVALRRLPRASGAGDPMA
jgi:hypothetical protein